MTSLRLKLSRRTTQFPIERLAENLTDLFIYSEVLESLPQKIAALKCLTSLEVNMPGLRELPDISQLKSLKKLKIRGGNLTSIDGLLPSNLEFLKLTDCGLSEFPSQIWELNDLKELDMSKNKIESLPLPKGPGTLLRINFDQNCLTSFSQLGPYLPGLLHLSLDGNPLSDEEKNDLYQQWGIWF